MLTYKKAYSVVYGIVPYLVLRGSLCCPLFDNEGNKLPDSHLMVSLGAARDSRWDAIRPAMVTVVEFRSRELMRLDANSCVEKNDTSNMYHFHFRLAYFHGLAGYEEESGEALCCFVESVGDSPSPQEWRTARCAQEDKYYTAAQYYARMLQGQYDPVGNAAVIIPENDLQLLARGNHGTGLRGTQDRKADNQ